MKGAQDRFGVVKAVGLGFDVPERVSLETDVVGAHFEDVQKVVVVARAAAVPERMDDGKGEFALGQIVAEAFCGGHLDGTKCKWSGSLRGRRTW